MKTVLALGGVFRDATVRQKAQGILSMICGICERPLPLQKTQGRRTLKEH